MILKCPGNDNNKVKALGIIIALLTWRMSSSTTIFPTVAVCDVEAVSNTGKAIKNEMKK
jgi:hypothetical protein